MPLSIPELPGLESLPLWTVSALSAAIKKNLEEKFPLLRVEGEISNYRPSSAGHIYFTLKDSGAVISAALFKGRASRIRVLLKDGMKVVVQGRLDVYPPRGSYQIIVEDLEEAGQGALLEALERRKQRLAAEGLFDQDRKKILPPYPRRVAVITSPTGAALQDILRVLARRAAAPRITILPCPVQGEGAGEKIAGQLQRAGAYALGEVVILARGGGSLEDLLAFSDETVVRAVADCPLPVVAGIGHEIDFSLADLAADIRAATPSTAAELVSDRSEDLLIRLRGFQQDNGDFLQRRLETLRQMLRPYTPALGARLIIPRIQEALRQVDDQRSLAEREVRDILKDYRRRWEAASQGLKDASPLGLMTRGYVHVSKEGKPVTQAASLKPGDDVSLGFARGTAKAKITEVEKWQKKKTLSSG